MTIKALDTPFVLTIVHGKTSYEREVLHANTGIPQGVKETGSGDLTRGGEVSLTGEAASADWRYSGTYTGRLQGTAVELAGQQIWSVTSKRTYQRPCAISLRRSG